MALLLLLKSPYYILNTFIGDVKSVLMFTFSFPHLHMVTVKIELCQETPVFAFCLKNLLSCWNLLQIELKI